MIEYGLLSGVFSDFLRELSRLWDLTPLPVVFGIFVIIIIGLYYWFK